MCYLASAQTLWLVLWFLCFRWIRMKFIYTIWVRVYNYGSLHSCQLIQVIFPSFIFLTTSNILKNLETETCLLGKGDLFSVDGNWVLLWLAFGLKMARQDSCARSLIPVCCYRGDDAFKRTCRLHSPKGSHANLRKWVGSHRSEFTRLWPPNALDSSARN